MSDRTYRELGNQALYEHGLAAWKRKDLPEYQAALSVLHKRRFGKKFGDQLAALQSVRRGGSAEREEEAEDDSEDEAGGGPEERDGD